MYTMNLRFCPCLPEHPEYFTTGTGALGEAPFLARRPRTDPVLGGARDVALHERCRAPLRAHDVRRHLLDGGQVDDDGAVDEGDDHDHAEHDGEKHAEAEPLFAALRRQFGLGHPVADTASSCDGARKKNPRKEAVG